MNLSRLLNIALIALLATLAWLLLAPRLLHGAVEPSFAELHAAALERLAAGAQDAIAALEKARAAARAPQAVELYGRAIDHLRGGRREIAEVELAEAARTEEERWLDAEARGPP